MHPGPLADSQPQPHAHAHAHAHTTLDVVSAALDMLVLAPALAAAAEGLESAWVVALLAACARILAACTNERMLAAVLTHAATLLLHSTAPPCSRG